MNNELVIVGGGDFCWEVLSWSSSHNTNNWKFKGFIDDDIKFKNHTSYLGTIESYKIKPTDRFVCAIGNTVHKLKICSFLEKQGAEFINCIHSTAVVDESAKVGKGCIISPHTYIAYLATVGNHVSVNVSTSVGHHAYIADGCTLNSHADITGHAHLEEGVFLGSHVSILPGKKIKAFSKIGAGSVIVRDIKETGTYFGVPAKRISS